MSGDFLGLALRPEATFITLEPPVRDQLTVQDVLAISVPKVLAEYAFADTTLAAPGVEYSSDTRDYEGGYYLIAGSTNVSGSNNNTQVILTFSLDGQFLPNAWADTPSGGTLSSANHEYVFLSAGPHTLAIWLARGTGTGAAEAIKSVVSLTFIGATP